MSAPDYRHGVRVSALFALVLGEVLFALAGCAAERPGAEAYTRRGDEIMVCGRLFHTGAPVVLWTDPGGYDAYRTEKRFAPMDKSAWTQPGTDAADKGPGTPNRYGIRAASTLPADLLAKVRGGGWDLPSLQKQVNQFVVHYDVCGTSRQCFRVLHDVRGLSVHFMLDVDGTIYQTLDLKERAWHASVANDSSVGVEIANIGAYPRPADGALLPAPLPNWYVRDPGGWRLSLPEWMGDGGVRTPGFLARGARPRRPEPIVGQIHGRPYVMFDLTPQQYDSLIKLTAALASVFPDLPLDCPRNADGSVRTTALSADELAKFRGVLGHFHVTDGKTDPGPAFDWEYVLQSARRSR